MILFIHMLLGAAIGQKIANPFLAIILAIFSHYFLDLFPHIEYSIKNIKEKNWHKARYEILYIFLDFFSGILTIFLFSKNYLIIYICALFSILPDALSLVNLLAVNVFLKKHSIFHQQKIHFLKYKKISIFWRIFFQLAAVIASIILIKI